MEEIWLNVTNKCNLRCIQCHLSSGKALDDELTTNEILSVIDQYKEIKSKNGSIVISGGEPLLRDDILDILEYIAKKDINISLITNGTLISQKLSKELKKLENLKIQVSLDGAKRETNDFIRGKGAYEETIKGIKNLIKEGMNPTIAMTIMKVNMNEILDMMRLAEDLGVKNLHFPLIRVIGRAKDNENLVDLNNEDKFRAYKIIQEIPKMSTLTTSNEFVCKIKNLMKTDLCGAGRSTLSIAANGDVYPCASLHDKRFLAGNVRSKSLKEIRSSPVLEKLWRMSVLDIKGCEECELKFICGGGCHATRFYSNGRLDSVTPNCEFLKKIYWHALEEAGRNE